MATLKTNTLTGTSTAGSIAVTGEGNSTTTNLQQGLSKCWINQSNGQTIRDSFNVATLTDIATGDYSTNFTNNFGNNDYSLSGISQTLETAMSQFWIQYEADYTTSSVNILTLYVSNTDGGGAARDSDLVNFMICGDLA